MRTSKTVGTRGIGDGACPRTGSCGLQQLFDEAEELVRCTFASVTLSTLARRTGDAKPR